MAALLSDVDGAIRRVFLALPGRDTEVEARIAACQAGILDALGPAVDLVLLHHPRSRAAARVGAGRATLPIPWRPDPVLRPHPGAATVSDGVLRVDGVPWSDFTPWVQDVCLVTAGPDPALWVPPRIARADGGLDEAVAGHLAAALGWPAHPLPTALSGANVAVDANRILLGGSQALHAAGSMATLVDAFGAGRSLHCLPMGGPEPIEHQDLYLALAGRDDDGRPVAMLGSEDLAVEVAGDRVNRAPWRDGLEGLAPELERLGYRVERVPIGRVRVTPQGAVGAVSYANVLVEVSSADGRPVRRVTLPAYGSEGDPVLAALDARGAAAWEAIGFTVRFAHGPFAWLARAGGGVRCLCKVLSRS